MKRTHFTHCMLAAAGLALLLAAAQAAAQPGRGVPRGNCYLNQVLPGANAAPTQPLTDAEKTALNDAIQDEYKARATYNKVLDSFGQVLPFANIVNAEDRHVEVLAYLHERYGIAVPEDTWADNVPAYATLLEAAEASVQAEIENGALYDTMLEKVSNPEVINVFNALRFATMEHHLPAFQRFVAVQNGVPVQPRAGRGQGFVGRGRGGCCAAANWNAAPRGAGYGRGAGLGRGAGRGAGKGFRSVPNTWQGYGAGRNAWAPGRGAGRGWAQGGNPVNPYCPYNAN